jgi:hypothetical protein
VSHVEDQAAARHAGFGLGELGDVYALDREAVRAESLTSPRRRGRAQQRLVDAQRVGRERLVGVHVDRPESPEVGDVHPTWIDENRVVRHHADRRLEVQASTDFDRGDAVAMWREQIRELPYTVRVRAARQSDVDALTSAHDVAAVERAGRFDRREVPVSLERGRYRSSFGAPRFRARTRNHRELIEHDGGVLDEDRVWVV